MYTVSTEKKGLICKGTLTLSQKHTLNFDPFALFMSMQRIVGKNSLRFCIVHTVLGQIYSFTGLPGFGIMLTAFKANSFR